MNLFNKHNHYGIAFLLLTIVAMSFVLVRFFPDMPIVSDSEDYHTIAANIMDDHTYPAIANQTLLIYPPLYPLLITMVYALTEIGSYTAVYALQYVLVGLTAMLVFFILRRFAKAPIIISTLAALSMAFWPYLILYSQLISSEVLYTFLLVLFFMLFFSIRKQSNRWIISICAGVVLGCVILTRPVALLLLPWILIGLFFVSKLPRVFGVHEIPWKRYFAVLIISVATLLPWELYVYRTHHEIIPVASNLGNVFTKANKTLEYLPEIEKPSILKAKAKNLYLFWDPGASGYHIDILKESYPIAGIAVFVYKALFFIILALAAIGAVLYRRNRLVLYSLLPITYTWAVHTVLFPFPRYTLPIMPFVIIVAVLGITHGLKTYAENPHSHPGA